MTRRELLGTTLRAGLLAAGAGAVGGLLDGSTAVAAPVEPLITQPPQPSGYRRYASRPDLRPPTCNIETASGFPYSSAQPRYIFSAVRGTGGGPYPTGAQAGVLIQDITGALVWFQPSPSGQVPFDFRVQTYQGKPVLTWFQGRVGAGWATSGEGIVTNAAYQRIAQVTAAGYQVDLHELLLTPEGTAMVTAYATSGSLEVSHALEVDIPTGQVVWDWSSYPAVPTTASYAPKGTPWDYFHINSIDLWPGATRKVLISSRNTCAVYLIDYLTKEIKWRVGGKSTNVPHFNLGSGVQFWWQHDARALLDGSGISLFDDASQPSPEKQSSGKVITLDQTTHTATLRHQYFHTDALIDTPREGNLQLLGNGGHAVGWGSSPYFSQFRASGNAMHAELVLDGRWPGNVESYRTYLFDWKGDPPASELKLVVKPTGGTGHFTAWASWNGATEVAAWRFNAGSSASTLQVVGTVPKRYFETSLDFTRVGAKAFEVAALDRSGRVLGRSSVVSAT